MLIISDPHFGKTGHFRKAGINVPLKAFQNDLHRLFECIEFFKPETLLIDGDLFHSSYNKEIAYFFRWRHDTPDLKVLLVKGNHDKFPDSFYEKESITVAPLSWHKGPFCFVHDIETLDTPAYAFSGHIHPSIQLHGAGRQFLRLPCFYFSAHYAILPAFGNFNGSWPLQPAERDILFAITGEEVIRI